MSIIDDIITLEWQAFDKVQNEGGRANCQEDFDTFQLMRAAQCQSWDPATLMSYFGDLQQAQQVGRNLVQEKYARMMASTAPEQYASFAHTLPALSDWQRSTIERIVAQQLAWRLAFAAQYPFMSSQSRLIRSEEDTPYATSFETYLRGELGTYSPATLTAYQQMIENIADEGENITTITMRHTAKRYGYANLDAAEQKLRTQYFEQTATAEKNKA